MTIKLYDANRRVKTLRALSGCSWADVSDGVELVCDLRSKGKSEAGSIRNSVLAVFVPDCFDVERLAPPELINFGTDLDAVIDQDPAPRG